MPRMSSTARWSYTAKATLWAKSSRDGWTGAQGFAAPVAIDCDYSTKAEQRRDSKGVEFTATLTVYTERQGIKLGDRILIGTSTASDPIAAGAQEVRKVNRQADVFDRSADDYEVSCGE
jgi:hypothetical protein